MANWLRILIMGAAALIGASAAALQDSRARQSLEGGVTGNSQAAGETSEVGNAAVAAAAQLREAVRRIDPRAEFSASGAVFRVNQTPVTLIYDINADRMRLVTPISTLDEIEPEIMIRLMQANFESALDARYAIAQGIVWSTFIHPLSSLTPDEFGSGLGQTVNLVTTFGSAYTSGALIFGGGDTASDEGALIEELKKKSSDI